jgi:dipeptidyl aminopeptidase/acylaminoacyl peptidase
MTTPLRHERDLQPILSDLAMAPYPDYVDGVLGRTGRMRQRPAWTFPGRWLPMDITTRTMPIARMPWRQLGILALIALLLAVALAVYVGTQRRVPSPFGPARNGLIPYISNGDIYVGDPVTGRTRLLIQSPQGAGAAEPGFSPDGTRLAFMRDVPTANTRQLPVDLYVARDDGTDVTKITSTPLTTLVWATWTPDGRRLAVIHPVDGVNQLELLDVEGRLPPQRLTAAVNADLIAFRPPDGREILFRAVVGGMYGLFAMDADGTNLRTLVKPTNTADLDQDLNAATYSADGSRIFYQRWFPNSIQLRVMNADGTGAHAFISKPGPGWDGVAQPSPDGRWVAFWDVPDDGSAAEQRISVIRADGTGPVIETGPGLAGTAGFLWSPDSTKILMIPSDGSSGSAFLLDPAGGPWTTVPWRSDLDLDWQRLAP